jgi:ATP synthase protein I
MAAEDPKKRINTYAKYSGLGFQLIAIVALGAFAGVKLDERFPVARFPLFTVTLSFLAIGAAMYFLFREATRK